MQKRCIGCKRNIAKDLQQCYFCGAHQGFIRYYRNSIIVTLILLLAVLWSGYRYIEKITLDAQVTAAQIAENKNNELIHQLNQTKLQLEQANNRFEQANEKIKQAQANATQGSDLLGESKLQLQQQQDKTKKAESRANWLSKENGRLKSEIKSLTEKLAEIESSPAISNQPEPAAAQIASLKGSLSEYEKQKQELANAIALKKSQIENDSPQETAAAIEQKVTKATTSERDKLQLLDQQITEIKQKILELESPTN